MQSRADIDRHALALVILHYSGLDDTRACLRSVRSTVRPSVLVYVVINGNGDDASLVLPQEFPWARVIVSEQNLGFAGGNNIGIHAALVAGAGYVALLNNDTVVESGFLEPLLSVFDEHPDAGMVTGPVLYAAPPNRIWSVGGTWGGWTALTRHALLGQPRTALFPEVRETEYANGCFVMLSKACIEIVGLMDERYFLYYEDTDWCARARKAGFKIYYTPGPAVLHKVSAGTKGLRPLLRYYCDRNSLYFARQNLPWYAASVYLPVFVLRMAYRFANAMLHRDREAWRYALHTLRDVFGGRMGPYPGT